MIKRFALYIEKGKWRGWGPKRPWREFWSELFVILKSGSRFQDFQFFSLVRFYPFSEIAGVCIPSEHISDQDSLK